MKKHHKGLAIFIAIILFGFLVGRTMLTIFVFGAIMLASIYVIVESIAPLKWMLSRTTKLFDIILFVFATIAVIQYGYNIAGGLAVCGLGYSLYYSPKLRDEMKQRKRHKRNHIPNVKNKFDLN